MWNVIGVICGSDLEFVKEVIVYLVYLDYFGCGVEGVD